MILCLESSADPSVVGIVEGESHLVEHVFTNRDSFADEVEAVLRETNVEPRRLTQIAVGIGPGSFTGLRVSLAYAKGMARGLSIPIWPVPSLLVIAANLQGSERGIAVISPARKGQVHFALFDPQLLEIVDGPAVVSHENLAVRIPSQSVVLGPGVVKLDAQLRAVLADRIPADAELHRPHARHLARLAREMWWDATPPDISAIVPEYGIDFPA